jgi:hypothetical protein
VISSNTPPIEVDLQHTRKINLRPWLAREKPRALQKPHSNATVFQLIERADRRAERTPIKNRPPVLKLRPTGLGSGIDKDRPDYTVFTGEWEVGRIYKTRGGPDSLRWFWSMNANGPMTRSDRVAILEGRRRSFRRVGTPGRRGRSWKS